MARFDEAKTLAAMLYITKKIESEIDLYTLVKLLYFADKAHLHKWGRTITGDRYAKMAYGYTPLAAYDMLKSMRGDQEWEGDLTLYLIIGNGTKKNIVTLLSEPDMDEFSDSDLEILDKIIAEYVGKSFSELRAFVHCKVFHPATFHGLAGGDTKMIGYARQEEEDERFLELRILLQQVLGRANQSPYCLKK